MKKKFPIHEVRVDDAVYPFISTVYGYCELIVDTFVFQVVAANVVMPIIGKGRSLDEARQDWERQFHLRFHELYIKCDWERSEEEQQLWEVFEEIVDIQSYRKLTPLKFEQTGKIIQRISDDQCVIEWIGGQQDIVNYVDCPSELAQHKAGEYFRADVLREYETDNLVRICSIFASDYRDYTHEELDKIIDSLPTTKDFPTAWITLILQE
jgi:hypothetical protein